MNQDRFRAQSGQEIGLKPIVGPMGSGSVQQPAGMPVPQRLQSSGHSFQQGALPQNAVRLAGTQAPPQQQPPPQTRALPAPPQPQMGADGLEAHTIVVHLAGPDGQPFVAEFDAMAPRGSKVMGVSERR